MRYTTKTEYGVVSLMYMARHYEPGHMITLREIVKEELYSAPFVEKILQKLKSSGLVVSSQGNQGGYALAKPPQQINLKQIIEALEGSTYDVFCEPHVREGIVCTHLSKCGLNGIWRQSKELLDRFYESITLDMLATSPIVTEIGPGKEQSMSA